MSHEVRDQAGFRAKLIELDYSMARIGRRVGCSRQFISHLANGMRSCSAETAAAIERELGVPVGTFFGAPISAVDGQTVRTRRPAS